MLKTNYRISKNLKVVLAAFLLCAQFLLIVTDAFSIEQDHLFSNELCTENTLIELSDAYDLDAGSDCDHCCSCHGHFTHIAFYFDIVLPSVNETKFVILFLRTVQQTIR